LIQNLISNTPDLLNSYIVLNKPTSDPNNFSIISSHSPVNLLAIDSLGNKTGFMPIPGSDFSMPISAIPGSSVEILDDEEYLLLPKEGTYGVTASGYADGFATLDTGSLDGSGIARVEKNFEHIPVTASSSIRFQVSQGEPTPPQADIDGDGNADITITSSESAADPISYITFMQDAVTAMAIDKKAQIELNIEPAAAKLLLNLEKKTRGAAAKERVEKLALAALDVFGKTVDRFVQNFQKPHNKQPALSPVQAAGVLDMLNTLRSLI
jgi:hypothetical protein